MNSKLKHEEQPWWNRPIHWNEPIIGNVSLLELMVSYLNRQQVPDLAISLHHQTWQDLNKIAPTIKMQDKETYNQEFLRYVSLKHQVENNQDDYKGLNTCIRVLQFAIENNSNFRNIYRIELDYQGKTQLELYNFVSDQLEHNLDKNILQRNIKEKIDEVISLTKNELIKNTISSYFSSLNVLVQDEIGLNLLRLFKKYNLSNSTVFDKIIEIIQQLKKQELENLESLNLVVEVNYETLEKLGRLIGISKKNNQPLTYAKILQYVTLYYKYDNYYFRFQQLINNLKKWEKYYQNLNKIREEYPSHKYKLPEEFLKFIPGENIYEKYKQCLSISS